MEKGSKRVEFLLPTRKHSRMHSLAGSLCILLVFSLVALASPAPGGARAPSPRRLLRKSAHFQISPFRNRKSQIDRMVYLTFWRRWRDFELGSALAFAVCISLFRPRAKQPFSLRKNGRVLIVSFTSKQIRQSEWTVLFVWRRWSIACHVHNTLLRAVFCEDYNIQKGTCQ